MNIPGLDTFNDIQSDLLTRLLVFLAVVVVFTLIIDVLKLDNHFYGLNSETGTMETVYFVCLSFSGMGYGGIYAQTSVSRLIMVILSVIKFILIIDTFALVTRDSSTQDAVDQQVKQKMKDLNLDELQNISKIVDQLDGPNSIVNMSENINKVKDIFKEHERIGNDLSDFEQTIEEQITRINTLKEQNQQLPPSEISKLDTIVSTKLKSLKDLFDRFKTQINSKDLTKLRDAFKESTKCMSTGSSVESQIQAIKEGYIGKYKFNVDLAKLKKDMTSFIAATKKDTAGGDVLSGWDQPVNKDTKAENLTRVLEEIEKTVNELGTSSKT